jgi:hypothetical protein
MSWETRVSMDLAQPSAPLYEHLQPSLNKRLPFGDALSEKELQRSSNPACTCHPDEVHEIAMVRRK